MSRVVGRFWSFFTRVKTPRGRVRHADRHVVGRRPVASSAAAFRESVKGRVTYEFRRQMEKFSTLAKVTQAK
jgi:hypothetical protein